MQELLLSPSRATLVVDLGALVANYLGMSKLAAPARVAAMVKADAYGLGAAQVGPALWEAGCRYFYVAHLEEGIALRAVLPKASIAVLNGVAEGQAAEFHHYGLIPTLNDAGQGERWEVYAATQDAPPPAYLHVDTGLNRLGFTLTDAQAWVQRKRRFAVPQVVTHFACADAPDHPLTQTQLGVLGEVRALLPEARLSLSNSAATLRRIGQGLADEARIGAGLYGLCTSRCPDTALEPVARLLAPVLQLRRVDTPGTVGYGAQYPIGAGGKIAILPVGYADGVPWKSEGACIALHHAEGIAQVPIAGRVSMDLIALDVSDLSDAALGGPLTAEIYGPNAPMERLAQHIGAIAYEPLTRLSAQRLARRYLPAMAVSEVAHARC